MPKPTALTEPRDHSKYVTVSRFEISKVLHTLAREATRVTASVGGNDFFLTSVLEVDQEADQVLIESGKRNQHKTRILTGQKVACSTSLEQIQICFQLDSLELAATHDGEEVFIAPLPRELFRLQRREHLRMILPMLPRVMCSIAPVQKDAPDAVGVQLADISCGGIAVTAPPEIFSPELGAYHECILKLPGNQLLKAQLQARNKSSIALAKKKASQRLGFQFIDLPESAKTLIQRYLLQLEFARTVRDTAKF